MGTTDVFSYFIWSPSYYFSGHAQPAGVAFCVGGPRAQWRHSVAHAWPGWGRARVAQEASTDAHLVSLPPSPSQAQLKQFSEACNWRGRYTIGVLGVMADIHFLVWMPGRVFMGKVWCIIRVPPPCSVSLIMRAQFGGMYCTLCISVSQMIYLLIISPAQYWSIR